MTVGVADLMGTDLASCAMHIESIWDELAPKQVRKLLERLTLSHTLIFRLSLQAQQPLDNPRWIAMLCMLSPG